MFRRESKPQNRIDSLIGATTRIEGNVFFSGGLRIDASLGVLEHEINAPQPIRVDAELNMGSQPLLPRDVMPDRLELVSAEAAGQFAMLRYRVLDRTEES